jgi:hypothetical protein
MSDKTPAPSSSSARWSVSRPYGIALSAATAVIVAVIGSALLPPVRKAEPPPAPQPVAAPPPAPAPPPTPAAGDAATDSSTTTDAARTDKPATAAASGEGSAPDAASAAAPAADAASPRDGAPDATTEGASAADGGGSVQATSAAESEASADCTLAEKDIAREAWRRNWPTICPVADGEKAFIIVPIKGTLENATWELRRKPNREARVSLPDGESLLTMKQYKLKRFGFKDLRIGAIDEGGARLRVKLQPGAGDPVFDVKDGYAKITVATPPKD